MLIRFTAPASIFDEDDEEVTAVESHRKFDGASHEKEVFTDFLGGPDEETQLALLLERGGTLHFQFSDSLDQLEAITEYRACRPLSDSEFEKLKDYTQAQWMDGIGENFAGEFLDQHGVSLAPDAEEIKAEQIDDGVPSVGNGAADLFRAINAADLQAVVKALPQCADINATLAGCTPLRWAITYQHPEIACGLAQHCDVHDRDLMGASTLHAVASSSMTDDDSVRVAQAIIQAGGNVNVADDSGRTPADYAELREKPGLHALLVSHADQPT